MTSQPIKEYDSVGGSFMNDSYRQLTKIVRNMKIERMPLSGELNDNETEILRYIIKHPKCIALHIAEYMNVDKALITRRIKNLKFLGFIEEEVNEEDKRKKNLIPTKKALDYKYENQNYEHLYYQKLFQTITEEEKEVFLEILNKLYLESKRLRKERKK